MNKNIPSHPSTELERVIEGMNAYFGIPRAAIETCHISNTYRDGKDITIFEVQLKDHNPPCIHCSNLKTTVHGCRTSHIKHSVLAGRNCEIHLKRRRYCCPVCQRNFSEENPFVAKRRQISLETVVNVLEDLKKPEETFASAARRYGIGASTAMQIFDTHVDMQRQPLSEYICIDENYAFKSDRSSYVCVLVNFRTQEAIDILPNRFKQISFAISNLLRLWKERKSKPLPWTCIPSTGMW